MSESAMLEFEHEEFDFETLEEELAVDERCRTLLYQFYKSVVANGGSEESASEFAYSVDNYLRDYVIDFCRQNVVRPQKGLVRYFAASWYITHSMDPEINLLKKQLLAISYFYRFLHDRHYISTEELEDMEHESSQTLYYQERIESFMSIAGDGYAQWNSSEPVPTSLAGVK